MNKQVNVQELKVGDFLSEIQYYKVVFVHLKSFESNEVKAITVENERGLQFKVSSQIIEEGMFSNNQVTDIVEVTRTQLIETFSHVGDTVFTVCFNKQADVKDIIALTESPNLDKKNKKMAILLAFRGEERILTGYLISTETGFGRSMVIDLGIVRSSDPKWDNRIRQVDHRSLNWLIHKGVKYIVK